MKGNVGNVLVIEHCTNACVNQFLQVHMYKAICQTHTAIFLVSNILLCVCDIYHL